MEQPLPEKPLQLEITIKGIVIDIAGKSMTAVSRAWGWKACKTKKLIGKEHRFGAGLGGSDAFVSTSCQRKLESLNL
jgi:hypothetical protein